MLGHLTYKNKRSVFDSYEPNDNNMGDERNV